MVKKELLLMECADCFTGGGSLQGCTVQKEKHLNFGRGFDAPRNMAAEAI